MKEYKFTLKPRFMPYLINEDLDKDPVTKEKLYSEKFMGMYPCSLACPHDFCLWRIKKVVAIYITDTYCIYSR